MASLDHPWSQLPTWTQWEELAFDRSYNSQAGNPSEFPFDNSFFTDILSTPSLSPNTTPSPLSNPTTPNSHPQNPSYRQRRTVRSPRSESSATGSAFEDASRRPISQRRKSQNRTSQRAFRQRRTERLLALQSRVVGLERQLDAAQVVNRLLAQMTGLRSLGETEVGEVAQELPACEKGPGFRTCDVLLLGQGLGGGYWDAFAGGEGEFEADDRVDIRGAWEGARVVKYGRAVEAEHVTGGCWMGQSGRE
ncbi:hypothetical protein V501_06078 [Pseudogymnoascus sp. VKM F-4519 (FW-2642)]|nr:hypothetical protein V501_06078 [Pseudogymnoascus sp. VKM F-4519 (FW-2642)]